MPKTVDTGRHIVVGLRSCKNLLQPLPYILVFGDCRRLSHALNPTSQCLLVSTICCMVSSLHPTSFLMTIQIVLKKFGDTNLMGICDDINSGLHTIYSLPMRSLKQWFPV